MTHKNHFAHASFVRGASGLSIAAALMSAQGAMAQATTELPGQAQTGAAANPNEAPSAEEQRAENAIPPATVEGDTILVTGFRQALESAVFEKKSRDLVVEAISAEDIGKLPDASIAESIARLPGLTSQRVSGRSNSISIRGFAPDFSTTLLNGREQTSTGDARAVEYDQYPSEVVSQVLVYKTPMASLVGQGLSGTVDLRTIRPLEFGRQAISLGARGTYADLGKLNVGSKEFGYRVNATYIDQLVNDTLGVALSASYLNEPYQIQEFNAWGYAGVNGSAVIGGSKSYVTSTVLERLGLQGTLQAQPAPNFTSTFDAFFSDFKDDQIKRGVELPLAFGAATTQLTNATVEDGFVRSGTFNDVEGVVRNDVFERSAKLYSFGWNNQWDGDNGWNAETDISYSRTDRNELVLESNAGTGRGEGVGATDTIDFITGPDGTRFDPTLNYGDYDLIQLTSPLGWGGTQIGVNGDSILNGQDGFYNNRIVEDELWQFRAELEREFDNFLRSVQAGVNYTDRNKTLTPDEAFIGLVANTDGTVSLPVPTEYRKGLTDLTYLGLGQVISYDPRDLLEGGIYKLVPNPYGDVVVKAYDVAEEIITGYLQGNIDADVGASQLTGNVGVQAIFTDQSSRGATATFLGTNPNGSPNIGATERINGASYVDVLPSLNLSLRLPSDLVIRASATRQIIRPRLDELRTSLSYGYQIVGDVARATGSSGNPDLRPWRANALDLTFEKYFGSQGYLAAQLFFKDLKSYIYNLDTEVPTSELVLAPAGTNITILPTALINQPINGEGGTLYGIELAGTLPLGEVVGALEGFGVTGGVSYTETKIQPTPGGNTEDIPGYSKWVANGTAYFEKGGFSARGSVRYRSSFVGEVSGFGAVRTRRRARPEAIVDAQIGYDFSGGTLEGVSVFLQGQNLTDEPFVTTDPASELAVIDFQRYGRRFLAGATLKF